MKLLAVLLLLLCSAVSATAQELRVSGLDGAERVFTAAELAALPRARLELDQRGVTHVYEGPLLATLLAETGAPLGQDLRGPAFSLIVLVTCADGYRVVLALADVDPAFRDQTILLADRRDGAAMDAPEGPFRLVVEGDRRPARSARMVVSIEILRAAPVEPTADAH